MMPDKLKPGDEIRVIAPAGSLKLIGDKNTGLAKKKLESLGFKVTFGKHVMDSDAFESSSIESRIEDMHGAFRDKKVKAILTVIGGYNSNQLLRYLDYDLIRKNPKILCGFSDITALSNAIYAKTGMVTYSGPHFASFAMDEGFEYTLEHFKKALMEKASIDVKPSKEWSDDEWYKDPKRRGFIKNPGHAVLNEGKASGTIVGGNICTFQLLFGTEYMPSLKGSIVLIEEDDLEMPEIIERDIQSLIHQPGFDGVKGILIGRFQKKTQMTPEKLYKIIKMKRELDNIPVVAGLDFGHTSPMLTIPIGGKAYMDAYKGKIEIKLS